MNKTCEKLNHQMKGTHKFPITDTLFIPRQRFNDQAIIFLRLQVHCTNFVQTQTKRVQ